MNDPVSSKENHVRQKLRLLLLPGMDGTGELFSAFLKSLPAWNSPHVVRYPKQEYLSFAALLPMVRSAMPASEPFVLVAESFSTPIAVQLAADPPTNMRALVICAGFIHPPILGIPRWFLSALSPLLFRLPLPALAIRSLLGRRAPQHLVDSVRTAIVSVSPGVLARRLRAVLACNETECAARISMPVLYIRPKEDRLVGQKAFRAVCSAMPGLVLESIAGPHLILQREPRAAAVVIASFLDRVFRPSTTSS